MLPQNRGMPRSHPVWLPALALAATLSGAAVDAPSIHWAYQPVSPGPVPVATRPGDSDLGWIDRYLHHAARAHGLEPAPEADRATLCRRLHLVLTGLPPAPEELESFLADRSVDPVARRADELLASPRFGERWARHWLDVVRYADSVTLRGFVFKESWRFRDFVIDSFNADRPFDQFIREQVAGDLLGGSGLEERRRGLIATTFWMLGDTNLEEQDKRQLELDVVDEQLDVLGKAFLGQTISCARCHDHKFDPIPTRDYHALAGILSGMQMLKHSNVSEWTERSLPGEPDEEKAWSAAEDRVRQLETELKAARAASVAKPAPTGQTDPPSSTLPAVRDLEKTLANARAGALRPRAMAPIEVGATNLPILRRGNWRNAGETVPRGVLTVAFSSPAPRPGPGESGRRELAEWLVHPENPLTSRVCVNRVWHWVFGAGLVRSTDNFGTTGDVPTHPELLEGLAAEFMQTGWSVKRLVRQLVTSQAFRRSGDPIHSTVTASMAADPSNRWLARFTPRRAEAEVLHDSMRWVSGTLDLAGHGDPGFPSSLAADYGHVATGNRRSIYQPVFRNARPEGLTVFDAADPCRVTGAREASATAPQALYFLNHPLVREQAAATAQRLLLNLNPVEELWLRTLGRPPTAGERRQAEQHLEASTDRSVALTELAQALFGSIDFRLIP